MSPILKRNRFMVLGMSIVLSIVEYLFVLKTSSIPTVAISQATQIFALTAVFFLYITLLVDPFCKTFKNFSFNEFYLNSKKDLIISTFYFAILHAGFAFFGELGGFAGLGFLSSKFLIAISFSFTALMILLITTALSIGWFFSKMTFLRWKYLSGLLYIAGIFVLVHALMLGSHFSNLSGTIPLIMFFAVSFLILLLTPDIDQLLERYINVPKFGLSFLISSVILAVVFFTIINPIFTTSGGGVSFDIHATHRQLAQQAAQQGSMSSSQNKIPGLNGDRTRRFTVSMSTDPENPAPNQDTTIHFKVYDASSGNSITNFQILYTKLMHFVIVNNDLTYFRHTHPEFKDGEFVITTQFPKEDMYHLYISFQPLGAIEQQIGFNLQVGNESSGLSDSKPDTGNKKNFGNYMVSVDTHGSLYAKNLSGGFQTISFTIKDKNGKPIRNLKPYLGSLGHLTMINQKSFDFIHVHPYNLKILPPDVNGGPTVDFLPIGIYGPFKPGVYRAFAEFNPDGKLFTADFTIEID